MPPSEIGVVGSGVAGLTAAHILQREYAVTLFERNGTIGGHTHTITLEDGPDAGTPIDTGFIVMNHRNYPLFTRLLDQLGVALRDSEMSFSYHDEDSGLQYSGSGLNGLFAQRANLFKPRFHGMVRDVMRFYREAVPDLEGGRLADLTLGDYLEKGRYGEPFVRDHLVPMGAAIWSMPCTEMMAFPAESFVQFFRNHGLLSLNDRPQWRTVVGGSQSYVKRILEGFEVRVHRDSPVSGIARGEEGVTVTLEDGREERFERVVVAAHADEALALLRDPSDDERRLLGAWRYTSNETVLHCDSTVMPPLKRAWASWNYTREAGSAPDGPATLTYDMNRLQGLETERRYFVTLNRRTPIPDGKVITRLVYSHPCYTQESLASQEHLPNLNGNRGTYFCGSYFGYGFHEDAVRSAVQVCRQMGLDL